MNTNTALAIYEPLQTGFGMTVIVPLILSLLLAGLAFYLNKKEVSYENRNYKNLGFLFCLFGVMLSFVVAGFSAYNFHRMQAVELLPTQVKVENRLLEFQNIKRVFLHRDFQASHISPQIIRDTTYLLIIEEKNGKSHAFSDENYPIREMVVAINKLSLIHI